MISFADKHNTEKKFDLSRERPRERSMFAVNQNLGVEILMQWVLKNVSLFFRFGLKKIAEIRTKFILIIHPPAQTNNDFSFHVSKYVTLQWNVCS